MVRQICVVVLLLLLKCFVVGAESPQQPQPSCGSTHAGHSAGKDAGSIKKSFGWSEGWAAEDHAHIFAHLSTKTPYRLIANHDTATPTFPGCRPQRLWSMIRHGTRLPKQRVFDALSDPAPDAKLQRWREQILQAPASVPISADARAALREWPAEDSFTRRLRVGGDYRAKDLAPEGWTEMLRLAERMQERFPELLPDVYRNESFRFKFTRTQRARASFEAFATGLFGRNNIEGVWHEEATEADPVLRFYKACARWKRYKQRELLADDALMEQHKAALLPHLGAFGLIALSTSDLSLLHDVCTFETAWQPAGDAPSPWCALFDAPTMRAIDFQRDYVYWQRDGYARPLTYRQACPALNDMLHRLTRPSAAEPPATFYFTHSGTILKLLALLGLYRDERALELSQWTDGTSETRRWRAGQMDAFGSNLAFVLYECEATTGGGGTSEHLLVQHQERTVRLDGCPTDSDLCPLALFKSIYRHALGKSCRFREMCALDKGTEKSNEEGIGGDDDDAFKHEEL